jgi:hypothetical protein
MRRGGTLEGEEDAGVPLRRCWPSNGCEDFLYTIKAGPAGGRLRRPSSRRQRHDGRRGAGPTLHGRGAHHIEVKMVSPSGSQERQGYHRDTRAGRRHALRHR